MLYKRTAEMYFFLNNINYIALKIEITQTKCNSIFFALKECELESPPL